MKTATLYGFGKRGKIWFKHLVEEGYDVSIIEPKLNLHAKQLSDLYVVASSNDSHYKCYKEISSNIIYDYGSILPIIIEKPVVLLEQNLSIFKHKNVIPAYSERFKFATQFIKNLNLKPTNLQLLFPTTWLDTGIHLLDLIEYLGYNEFVDIIPNYKSSATVMPDCKFAYVKNTSLKLIISVDNITYVLDLRRNLVDIYNNGKYNNGYDFGPQNTIPTLLKNMYSVREFNANKRAIEYESSLT